jgi:hypothetical protein
MKNATKRRNMALTKPAITSARTYLEEKRGEGRRREENEGGSEEREGYINQIEQENVL